MGQVGLDVQLGIPYANFMTMCVSMFLCVIVLKCLKNATNERSFTSAHASCLQNPKTVQNIAGQENSSHAI